MSDHPVPLDEVVRHISLSWRHMRRGAAVGVLRQHLFGDTGAGIEQTQYDTLEVLSGPSTEPDGWRMGELADELHIDASTSTRTIDRLVASGWVERRHLGGDRRVVIVSLTDSGRQRIDEISLARAAGMRRLLEDFSEDEIRQLAELLQKFVGSMDALVDELDSARNFS